MVENRARAKALPSTSTCTLVEATARCGVAQGVIRDILERRGLLSRAKVRGLAIRIPEAKIRAIEAVMRDSVDVNGAAALLGTTWKVAKDLAALGILKPWVAGGRATKHAYVFPRAEAQGVLDRLATSLTKRLCVEEDEHAYAVPLAVLVREALEGRFCLRDRLETVGRPSGPARRARRSSGFPSLFPGRRWGLASGMLGAVPIPGWMQRPRLSSQQRMVGGIHGAHSG